MNFNEFLKENIVFLDGGMGTLLQAKGLAAGEYPELWNVTHPEIIKDIHKAYFEAGSNVVCSNTFGANCLKFKDNLEEIISAAIKNAKSAIEESATQGEKFVALDIGPLGKLLSPLGELDFEDAVEIFAKTVRFGAKHGADLVLIETMNDSYETKAALLAAKENCTLPIIVTNAYGEDSKLMTGASPEAMVALLEGMGVCALGANCSLGPKQLKGVAQRLLASASVPVVLKPNAGLPKIENGKTVFNVLPQEFSLDLAELVALGVRVVGGCCGTTPEYIKAVHEKLEGKMPVPLSAKNKTVVSSYTHAVEFSSPVLIGERINPTGKKRFKQALIENDINYILNEGVNQSEAGVHILDVNVGLPEIDEVALLKTAVCELQTVTDLPLQIDTSDPIAMEAALRRYNGKAMLNSVSGKRESMEKIFPLAKKYGGVIVALTLDENGIPENTSGRVEIAKKILNCAKEYGIDKKDIVFDTLAMTISANKDAARVTLDALKAITEELGAKTSLGVSNVSFGLPCRDAINSIFFSLALENGLSAAIMNPYSAEMMKSYYTFKALTGQDNNFEEYIKASEGFGVSAGVQVVQKSAEEYSSELDHAISKGFKEKAAEITKQLLSTNAPLDIVNNEIIPALNKVGIGFEEKTVYLPQLLMAAEAAKAAFEIIKLAMPSGQTTKGTFVLATVKGDIHDIGKNIVKLLLENYGYFVADLGKDVPPQKVLDTVLEKRAQLLGLSALMTTTVPAMEETIKLVKKQAPFCKIIVGGAVLTEDYAKKIGADAYAKDATGAVKFAKEVLG
ncbi:MAG: homocysteine S-methyltransferase family protein [Clostridia bacterium]|nr:homocysteine S-methyltransferase family protein [Clostridia bacterium]